MNISPVTNSPSMKAGLYFAKPGVLFNPKFSYSNPEGQKITQKGVRYFEDKELPDEIRKKVAEVPFIKKLSEKYETFVNVIHGRYKNVPYGAITITYADYEKMKVCTYKAEGDRDACPSSILGCIGYFALDFLKLIGTCIVAPFLLFEDFGSNKEEPDENPIDIAIEKINKRKFDAKYKT